MVLRSQTRRTYFYSTGTQQVLRHAFDHYLEEKVRVMHEFVHHEEVGVARLQQSWQVLGQLFVYRGVAVS